MNPQGAKIVTTTNVIAMFSTVDAAEKAWKAALNHGCTAHDLTVLLTEGACHKFYPQVLKPGPRTTETTGAVCAALAMQGPSLVIPGLGLCCCGLLTPAFTGTGGATANGFFGAALNAGMPDWQARTIEDHLKRGEIVLVCKAPNEREADAIAREWKTWCVEVMR